LKRFREELLAESSKQHIHVGEPCVVCALRGIFVGLSSRAFTTPSHDAPVAPTALRVALSAMYSDSNFFQEVFQFCSVISDKLGFFFKGP